MLFVENCHLFANSRQKTVR